MITLRGQVLLDPVEADYLARALAMLMEMLVERRTPPTERLRSMTEKLTRCAGIGSVASQNGSVCGSFGASQDDSPHHEGHATVSTAEAARILGTGERNVRDLARRERLPARRVGGRWVFDAAAVVERAERRAARRAG